VPQAKAGRGGKGNTMLAYTYPLLDLFLTMLWIFLFIVWIWILIAIFGDIFSSHDLGGWAKALWVIFVILIPFIGIIVYLIARGGGMHQRALDRAQQRQQAFDQYVRQTASTSGAADQLTKLAELKDKGVLTDAEFEQQKAALLAKS
jgi:ABC-type multidrug transport system fused ATPase/permease subunit